MRLLLSVAWSGFFVNPRQLRKWLDRQLGDGGVIEEEIVRLGRSFPSLVSTLITERDQYMVARLREAAAVLRPSRLVAVVGAGHLAGMVGAWEVPLDSAHLAALAVSAAGAEVYSPLPVAVTEDMERFANFPTPLPAADPASGEGGGAGSGKGGGKGDSPALR